MLQKNNSLILGTGVLVGMTLICGAVLSSGVVFADNDSVIDEVNITVPTACTLAGTLDTAHNATINPGQYQDEIGTTTLKALCNDSAGFAIYAAGYTGNTVGDTNSNKLIGQNTNELIPTGIGTSGDSQWAMKLTTDSEATYPITIGSAPNTSGGADASFSAYHVVPNEYTKVAYRTEGTDVGNNATGSTLTTTYAANIASTQAADTYSGKVIYTLVHPNTAPAPVDCNPDATTISEMKCMQDFANMSSDNIDSVFDSMNAEQQYTLKDSRDGKSYKIAKLKVGFDDFSDEPVYRVWMTQNLDLDIDSGRIYTNEDTDIGYNYSTFQYDAASWSPIRSTYRATSTQTHEWCVGGEWNSEDGQCGGNNTPESYDPGNLYWNLAESDFTDWDEYVSSCDLTTSTPVCDQSLNPIATYTSSTGVAQYHLGNYYNWAAALATNDSSVYSNNVAAKQSICPAGWTLPQYTGMEDTFNSLWTEYGWDSQNNIFSDKTNLFGSPLYFAASGIYDGALTVVGLGGNIWSPISEGPFVADSAMYDVSGSADPSTHYHRDGGSSVRCLVRVITNSN